MKKLGFVVLILAVAAAAFAGVTGKDGSTTPDKAPEVTTSPGVRQADFEWSSAGALDTVPTLPASSTGWASYFVVMATNTTGQLLGLDELGFPCTGPSSTWGVWIGTTQPTDPNSADYSGAFTPADTSGTTSPPTTYSYVDISASNIVIPVGSDFWIGYQNPALSGQVAVNSVITFGWYGGAWDSDTTWDRTTILQVTGTILIPVELMSVTVE